MKVTVRICRTAKVPTQYVKGIVGAESSATPAQVYAGLMKEFGPLAPGIEFFVEGGKTLVTKEVMAFDIRAKDTPFASGMATADMLTPTEVARMDGALESELARMGITTNPDEFEWRALYEVDGKADANAS